MKEEIEMANVPSQGGPMLAKVVQGGCGLSVLADLQRPRAHSPLQPAVGERAGAEGLAQRTSMGPFQPHPPVWLCALLFLLKALNSAPMPAGKGAGARDDPKLLPFPGSFPAQELPTPEDTMADTVRRGKRFFYCQQQLRGPRSHSGSAGENQSAPATTESESSDKPPEAGRGRIWFPLLWRTLFLRNSS